MGPRKMVAVMINGHTISFILSFLKRKDSINCIHDLSELYLLYRYTMSILMQVEIVILMSLLAMVAGASL